MGALLWPFRGRHWVRRLLLMGLINAVPVAGMMTLLGWTLACLDNLRAGRDELPPAGFQYLRRGWPLFLVLLCYWLALTAGYAVIAILGDVLNQPLDAFASPAYYLLLLAVTGLGPAIVIATDRGGVGAGLDVRAIVRSAADRPRATLAAAGFSLLLALVAHLGLLLVGVGILLTAAYSMPAWAAVIRRYEVLTA